MGIFAGLASGLVGALTGNATDPLGGINKMVQNDNGGLIGRGINAIADSGTDAIGQYAADKFSSPSRQGKRDKAYRDASYPGTNPWEQLASGVGGAQAGAGINAIAQKRQINNQQKLQKEQLDVQREGIAATVRGQDISLQGQKLPYEHKKAVEWGDVIATLNQSRNVNERERRKNLVAERWLTRAQNTESQSRARVSDARAEIEKANLSPALLEASIANSIRSNPSNIADIAKGRMTHEYARSIQSTMINASMHAFGSTRDQAAVSVAAALAAAGLLKIASGFIPRGGRGSPHPPAAAKRTPAAASTPRTSPPTSALPPRPTSSPAASTSPKNTSTPFKPPSSWSSGLPNPNKGRQRGQHESEQSLNARYDAWQAQKH